VPARVTILTDARLRPIQMGKQRIVFQTVAPKRLYWAGRPATSCSRSAIRASRRKAS
jgi:hypothetical protein